MSCIQQMDELVKEYLLFRGFSGTLKALDTDLKSDKDKAFRVRIFLFISFYWFFFFTLTKHQYSLPAWQNRRPVHQLYHHLRSERAERLLESLRPACIWTSWSALHARSALIRQIHLSISFDLLILIISEEIHISSGDTSSFVHCLTQLSRKWRARCCGCIWSMLRSIANRKRLLNSSRSLAASCRISLNGKTGLVSCHQVSRLYLY